MTIDKHLLDELLNRGLVAQHTDREQLQQHLESPITLYCGFDPTADSLHIGSLVPILMLRRFQLAGHRVIALVGGSTGLIGDPSFKVQERALAGKEIVQRWSAKIRAQLQQFLDFDGENPAVLANNYDWTDPISTLEFLRDFGKYFSVNTMIAKDSVKQRLQREDQGISFTEFSYSVLQAVDFYFLNKLHKCSLQVGGSDQWGNIVAGIELVRKKAGNKAYALTMPLITKTDGTKFGKSESGTIWLSAERTSPYAFYQFWINTQDADVYHFLRYFTFLSCEKIEAIEKLDAEASARPSAGRILAEQVTQLVHGEELLQAAQRISRHLFQGDIAQLRAEDWQQLQQDGLPSTIVDFEQWRDKPLTTLLSELGVAQTGKQVKNALNSGAISINNAIVALDMNMDLTGIFDSSIAFHRRYWLLKMGKKTLHLFYSQ